METPIKWKEIEKRDIINSILDTTGFPPKQSVLSNAHQKPKHDHWTISVILPWFSLLIGLCFFVFSCRGLFFDALDAVPLVAVDIVVPFCPFEASFVAFIPFLAFVAFCDGLAVSYSWGSRGSFFLLYPLGSPYLNASSHSLSGSIESILGPRSGSKTPK